MDDLDRRILLSAQSAFVNVFGREFCTLGGCHRSRDVKRLARQSLYPQLDSNLTRQFADGTDVLPPRDARDSTVRIRLPSVDGREQSGRCRPPVRSIVLRRPGAKTGVRLVDFASLREFLLKHVEPAYQPGQAAPSAEL